MGSWDRTWQAVIRGILPRRRTAGAAAVSAVVHAAVLSACAMWVLAPGRCTETLAIRTVWNESPPPEVEALEALPVVTEPTPEESGGSSLGEALFHQGDGNVGENVTIEVASLSALETTGQLPAAAVETQTVGLAGGQGQGATRGQGRGDGEGDSEGEASGGSFFGLEAEGRRVVYVVDASRSMNHPHPGPMKTRFGRVKLELVRSISAMTSQQEFFIIYFNDRAWPMPATGLKLAVPSVRQKYLRWAVEAKASGTTDPEQALLAALSLNPDVIYFLTDGAFQSRVVDRVRQANNRERVTIHTIGFGDDDGEILLKEIAFQNWGTYQFIPGDEEPSTGS